MPLRISFVCVLILLSFGYAVSPAFAVWQLMTALHSGDIVALQRGVDWPALRSGMKQDITDGVIAAFGGATGQTQLASTGLPPFGASFISGIAGNAIEREVTAENVAAMGTRLQTEEAASTSLFSRIARARFDSLTDFTLAVQGDDADDGMLKLHLELRGGHWVLVRAWIPQDMIDWVAQRT
jgi:hypothetical protein